MGRGFVPSPFFEKKRGETLIEQVLRAINCFYIRFSDTITKIETTGFTVSNVSMFKVGMYLYVQNSFMNDGVYRIASITGNKITTVEKIIAETSDHVYIYGLAIPKDVIALSTEISAYNATGVVGGIASESLGDYSVTYVKDSSWKSIYADRLKSFRHVYLDLPIVIREWVM